MTQKMQHKAISFYRPLKFYLLVALFSINTQANDVESGKSKSSMCISCHGVSGISSNQMWPNLAGQKRGYLIKALQDYKSGERKNAMMNSILKSLSEEDIQDISSYFSSLSESN